MTGAERMFSPKTAKSPERPVTIQTSVRRPVRDGHPIRRVVIQLDNKDLPLSPIPSSPETSPRMIQRLTQRNSAYSVDSPNEMPSPKEISSPKYDAPKSDESSKEDIKVNIREIATLPMVEIPILTEVLEVAELTLMERESS